MRLLLIALVLAAAVVVLYAPVVDFGFVNYDDNHYVTDNAHVQAGLTWAGTAWAFTTGHVANWHPLTWLSHMLDFELFGMRAGGHHLVNVLFHVANTVLLFLVLERMTGAMGRSAFVAALFGLHPQHVESVAWISERKDVMSTLFWMLTMGAYVLYVERPSTGRRIWVALLLALGLLAKPMLVTLPIVLLLLVFWPLGRLDGPRRTPLTRLLAEKVPLLALVLASSAVTLFVQRRGGVMSSIEMVSIGSRLANAVVAYATYLGKAIWPAKLSVIYSYRRSLPWQEVLGSLALLVAMTSFAVAYARRRPYLLVGWLWYVGVLVPVIGIIQVGTQAMADRYTYVSLIGPFIMVAWGAGDLLAKGPRREWILGAASAAVAFAYGSVARAQVRYWSDGVSLFRHAISLAPTDNAVRADFAYALMRAGRFREAADVYRAVLVDRPRDPDAHANLGINLFQLGARDEAIVHYVEALRIKPTLNEAHTNLGVALISAGRLDEAESHFNEALRLKRDDAKARYNLGNVLLTRGRPAEATAQYLEAVRIRPTDASAQYNFGNALMAQGKVTEALVHYEDAVRLAPDYADAHTNFGSALASVGRWDDAFDHWRTAIRFRPDSLQALGNLAWALASTEDPRYRDGREAVEVAERICQLTRFEDSSGLDVLAAAYAQAGRPRDAVAAAEKAIALARAAGNTNLAAAFEVQRVRYAEGKPYRDAR